MEPLDPWGETLEGRNLIEQMNKEYYIRILQMPRVKLVNTIKEARMSLCHCIHQVAQQPESLHYTYCYTDQYSVRTIHEGGKKVKKHNKEILLCSKCLSMITGILYIWHELKAVFYLEEVG